MNTFVMYQTTDLEWRWKLMSSEGVILCRSGHYTSMHEAMEAIGNIREVVRGLTNLSIELPDPVEA